MKIRNLLKIENSKLKIPVKQGGFTILESIVAIMILSLSISGVFAAVSSSMSQSIVAKDEIRAFYLAQEAVEMIRNKRDANQLARIGGSSNTWLTGIAAVAGDPCYFGKTCRADAYASNLVDCGGGWDSCPVLNQNTSSFLYSYLGGSSWKATNFKREVQLEQIVGSPNEIVVIVRVLWTKGAVNYEFKAKTHLFNWI